VRCGRAVLTPRAAFGTLSADTVNTHALSLSAALLVGGHSTRMGQDKALLTWHGRPLWQHQLEILRALAPASLYVVGRAERLRLPPGIDPVADAIPEAGPLAGLVAVLRRLCTTHLLLLGVDLPHMTRAWLQDLWQSCAPDCGVVPLTDRYEPLAAVYPKAIGSLAAALLQRGERRMHVLVKEGIERGLLKAVPVRPEDRSLLINANTPEEWARLQSPDASRAATSPRNEANGLTR